MNNIECLSYLLSNLIPFIDRAEGLKIRFVLISNLRIFYFSFRNITTFTFENTINFIYFVGMLLIFMAFKTLPFF